MPTHLSSTENRRDQEYPSRENALHDILMNAPIGFSTATPDGKLLSANPALARMLGYDSPEDLIASDPDIAARLHAAATEEHSKIADGPENDGAREFRVARKDGTIIWVSGKTGILRDAEGRISHTQNFTTDITDRKRMEAELEAMEKNTSMLVGSLPGMAFRRRNDAELDMEYVSDGCLGLTGYSAEELLHSKRLSFTDLILPEYRHDVRKKWTEGIQKLAPVQLEFEIMTADGQPKWVWEVGIPMQGQNGGIGTLEGLIVDITPRKLAEKNSLLREKALELAAVTSLELLLEPDLEQSMPRVLARLGQGTDTDRVYVFKNQPRTESDTVLTSQLYEWARPGIPTQIDNPNLQDLPMNDLTPRWLAEMRAGRSIRGLVRDFPADEKQILEPQGIISILVVPIQLHGTLWGFLGFDSVRAPRPWTPIEEHVLNIVSASLGAAIARRQAQEELASSNRTLMTILDSLPVDVYVADLTSYRILFMNQYIKDSFGRDCTGELCHEAFNHESTPCGHCTNGRLLDEHGRPRGVIAWECFNPVTGKWYRNFDQVIPWTDGRLVRIEIAMDLSDRKRAEEEILRARDLAEAANCAKSEFLANMSHEIRTPLNGVMGMLQLLQLTKLDPIQEDYTDTAIHSCNRLVRLLTDILDLSRIEAGKLSIQSAPLELSEVLRQTGDLFSPTAREKGLALRFRIDQSIPRQLLGDATRLQQVLGNMVGNSLKFTPAGSVTVEASLLPALHDGQCRVLFSVADSGIGIPDDKLGSLFQPFSQVTEGFTRSYQGAGLGLSICKRLVSFMGGNISVVSELAVGTTMYFSVTFAMGAEKAESVPGRESFFAPALDGLSVLMAEDDHFSGILGVKLLGAFGATVKHVQNGKQALEALASEPFDLVLMDVQMPVMDGVEATRSIRRGLVGDQVKNIPIIAMTSYAMDGDREKFLDAGMNAYVAKPVDIKDLMHAISQMLLREGAKKPIKMKTGP
ncbi:MAG: PAS domain S-box protein [Desulfomicrobium apsheronum]|nr:PAS domain S-box protein [Desulfomicrobium apsheronum]